MDCKFNSQVKFLVNIAYYMVIMAIVYVLAKYALGLLTPFILAFCLVSMVHPLIRKITSLLKTNQKIIAIIVIGFVYAVLGLIMFWIAMQVIMLVKDIVLALPRFYSESLAPTVIKAGNLAANILDGFPVEYQLEFKDFLGGILSTLQSFVFSVSERGISFVSGITNKVPSFFITLIFTIMLSFFISMQYENVIDFIKVQLPPDGEKFLSDLRSIFINTILKYARAYLILMTVTFAELSLGLSLLRVPNSIPLALFIAVFDILPVLGTGTILNPWALWELFNGNYSMALGLFIIYGVVYIVRNVVEPKVVGDQLGMNPIISITVMFIGFKLLGFFGMILMPVTCQILLALHKNGNIKLYK